MYFGFRFYISQVFLRFNPLPYSTPSSLLKKIQKNLCLNNFWIFWKKKLKINVQERNILKDMKIFWCIILEEIGKEKIFPEKSHPNIPLGPYWEEAINRNK